MIVAYVGVIVAGLVFILAIGMAFKTRGSERFAWLSAASMSAANVVVHLDRILETV